MHMGEGSLIRSVLSKGGFQIRILPVPFSAGSFFCYMSSKPPGLNPGPCPKPPLKPKRPEAPQTPNARFCSLGRLVLVVRTGELVKHRV